MIKKSDLIQIDKTKKYRKISEITLIETEKETWIKGLTEDRKYDFEYNEIVKNNTCDQP